MIVVGELCHDRDDFVRVVLDLREHSGERPGLVAGQINGVDHVARHVRYIETGPVRLVEAVMKRVAAVLAADRL